MVLPPEEKQYRLYLYEVTKTDAEMGSILGLTHHAVFVWRKRNGLPARSARPSVSRLPDAEMFALYQGHGTDREVAQCYGGSRDAANRWRNRLGLEPKYGCREVPVRLGRSDTFRKKWRAYCMSTSCREAAQQVGVTESSMMRWVRRHNLPMYKRPQLVRQAILKAARRGDPIAIEACRARRWLPQPRAAFTAATQDGDRR